MTCSKMRDKGQRDQKGKVILERCDGYVKPEGSPGITVTSGNGTYKGRVYSSGWCPDCGKRYYSVVL